MIVEGIKFKQWADQRTLAAIEQVDSEAFPREYAFMLQQINHMVIVQDLFQARLTDSPVPHKHTNSEIVPAFEALNERLIASGQWYRDYANTLNNEAGQRAIAFTFADGKAGKLSVEEILFHIVSHSSYHRGSIANALDQVGVPHPVDGYGIYIHDQEPARRQ